ncbi:MAG: flagellar export chaperone FliS [Pseudomonadota bacterium]|nr:flagellar export chaperone FliS [Pseudomonadota bacterium]
MSLKAINAYKKGNLKQEIAAADPHKLTLMLMQGAIDRIAFAKGLIERKDFSAKSEYISRAHAIIMHLRDTLDVEVGGETAQNMFALYEYMLEQLQEGHLRNDINYLNEVISLLTPIRDAWVQIPETAKQEAYELQRQKRQAV